MEIKTDNVCIMSVSKKIQLILHINKGKYFTSSEIYEIGEPWNVSGKTPRNTIIARCSTLYRNGIILKKDNKFYV